MTPPPNPQPEPHEPEDTILTTTRTIAVVGLTDQPSRDDHRVAAYLQSHGYRIVPINPDATGSILGETVYPDLASVPFPIDLVDVFRRSEHTGPHIDEAIAVGARAVWLQLRIRNDAALARAHAAGLLAVQDRCTMIEHCRWCGAKKPSTSDQAPEN